MTAQIKYGALLDRRLPDGARIADALLRPFERDGRMPIIVDIGARNGMFLLADGYARRATLVGFEPNPEEYQKLVHGRTDAQRVLADLGRDAPRFGAERYFDVAVWDKDETRPLYITQGAGACTMMGEVKPWMRDAHYLYPFGDWRRQKSFYDLHARITGTVDIPCKQLDHLLTDEVVDFLKIDAEGAELKILRGATQLFAAHKVLFVMTEFQLAPYYQDHGLLCDQHRWLADRGFRLIGLDFNHPRYRRGPDDMPDESDRGLLIAGDAFYMLDPDEMSLQPQERHRLGILAINFGFTSLGLGLLREAALIDGATIDQIKTVLAQPEPQSFRRRLLTWWMSIPYALDHMLEPAVKAFRWTMRSLRGRTS